MKVGNNYKIKITLILVSNNKLVLQATIESFIFDVFAILILSRSCFQYFYFEAVCIVMEITKKRS